MLSSKNFLYLNNDNNNKINSSNHRYVNQNTTVNLNDIINERAYFSQTRTNDINNNNNNTIKESDENYNNKISNTISMKNNNISQGQIDGTAYVKSLKKNSCIMYNEKIFRKSDNLTKFNRKNHSEGNKHILNIML